MRKLYFFSLLLGSLLPGHQAAWADGVTHVAFDETFVFESGTGGGDDKFSGTVAQNKVHYDLEGWSDNGKVYSGKNCIKFGTSDYDGICTTPEIILIGTEKTARLTFSAAGWGDNGKNTLNITANEGVTLAGDTQIKLANGVWTAYTVTIAQTTATYVQLTFTGRRGFLDDVKVEEAVTAINAPTLTAEHLFWPNTTEANATKHITLVPSDSTTVYYTTDGTEPSTANGQVATLTTNVSITGTTTVNARAYYGTVASSVVSNTYIQGTTVNGIAAFKALGNGTEARLYLADDTNARVLHSHQNKMFLRDNSGAICLDFGETAVFNPAPVHDQHVAGWIIGKMQDVNGMPTLVATDNTNTNYLAMAAPVTEQATEPVSIDAGSYDAHLADWVTIGDLRLGGSGGAITATNEGTSLNVVNTFNLGDESHYADNAPYDGALVDFTGIAIPEGAARTVAPVFYNNVVPIVYVIDENKDFTSPPNDIPHATVRLKRTLGKDHWNTFVIPIGNMPGFDGSIREYSHAEGTTMVFTDANSIEAGKPYLVKPNDDIVAPVYTDITLSATPANAIEDGGYSFVAVYSPTSLKTDKTEMFLKTDGKLYYPTASGTRLRGLRAFFRTPAGEAARLAGVDQASYIADISSKTEGTDGSVYDLQGRRVGRAEAHTPLKKGLYIVGGKKIVIR